jgi:hypothetical protein
MDAATLEVLLASLHSRIAGAAILVNLTPETMVRKMMPPKSRARFDKLLRSVFWREAAEHGGEFFVRMAPLAAVTPRISSAFDKLHIELGEHGVSLLRLAEWVTHNYNTVWLCHRFQTGLESGRLEWRRAAKLKRYGGCASRILEDASPFSEKLKRQLQMEYSRLKKGAESDSEIRVKFFRRKAALEKAFGGKFFGRKLGTHQDTPQQWDYFRQEIVNLVEFLEENLERVRNRRPSAYRITGQLLNLIAPEWYRNDEADAVGKRYREAKKIGIRGTPIPELPPPSSARAPTAIVIPE